MRKLTGWISNWIGKPSKAREEELSEMEKAAGFRVDRFQQTPNPEAAQFILSDEAIASGTKTFNSTDEAKGDPLAEALFNIFGIESVFVKENFITITKTPVVSWTTLMDPIQEAIEKYLIFYKTSDDEAPSAKPTSGVLDEVDVEDFPKLSDDQKGEVIDALLDKAIRPALANDGGGISLISVQGNVVKVHYQGACGSCPSSMTGTLQYIETFLKDTLSPDLTVQAQ